MRERNRPFGVTAIAFLQVVISVVALYRWWLSDPLDASVTEREVYLSTAAAALAVIGLIVAVGLLAILRWAWPLALFLLSVQLAVGLWAYYHNHPTYDTMFLSAVSIFYLNSRDVRETYGFVRARESIPVE